MVEEAIEILLVEDDPQDIRLTLRELERENLRNRIVVARDGEEALDVLFCRGIHKERSLLQLPKLVLLDLKLPKVDGLQVLQEIKSKPETKTIRSEEHTSELQSRGLISYAVFCLKK